MEYERRIKILAEGMRTYEASFNREVTEEDVANRIKLDGYIYDVKELRNKYDTEESMICKFKDITKCAKYMEELLQFLIEIENINFEANGLKGTDQYYSFSLKKPCRFFL